MALATFALVAALACFFLGVIRNDSGWFVAGAVLLCAAAFLNGGIPSRIGR